MAPQIIHILPRLRDHQNKLLLLWSCMCITKFFFGLRTCQPIHIEEATMLFEKELHGALKDVVVGGGSFFGDLQWRLTSLPIRLEGFRVVLKSRGFLICFCGLREQSWVLQDHIFRDSEIGGTISDFAFSSFTWKDTVSFKTTYFSECPF